jgi:hypothetical protein
MTARGGHTGSGMSAHYEGTVYDANFADLGSPRARGAQKKGTAQVTVVDLGRSSFQVAGRPKALRLLGAVACGVVSESM